MVVKRIFNIVSDIEDNSAFLFGARQTGKSTFLEHTLTNAVFLICWIVNFGYVYSKIHRCCTKCYKINHQGRLL